MDTAAASPRTSPEHAAWLDQRFAALLLHVASFAPPEGHFGYPTPSAAGVDSGPDLILTCRLTYVFAKARPEDFSRAQELVGEGVRALQTLFADRLNDGWLSPTAVRKTCYEHAFVLLAASAAVRSGAQTAQPLLAQALQVIDRHFWDPREGIMKESFKPDWTDPESYVGANSNMHAVEAYLAAAEATTEEGHARRALRVADQFVRRQLAAGRLLLPEHYDLALNPIPDYNSRNKFHQLRPYGSTVGHWLEWARLLVELQQALAQPPAWLLPAAKTLFRQATDLGWQADGHPGFVYTLDWDATVSVPSRLHWVLTEAIAAASALAEQTGEEVYEDWYREFWALAARAFLQPDGSWRHELDQNLQPSATVWGGRPDAYHASAALLSQR